MKRILVYGMTNNPGGMESYIMNVYRNMDKSQIMFDFIIDFEDMAYQTEVITSGSQIYKIPPKSKNPIGHLKEFCNVLKNHPEYDTVYFNILNAGAAFTMLAPKLKGRKVIVHSHNNLSDNLKLHSLFKPLLNKMADKKMACSMEAAKFMFYKYQDVFIAKNGIDTHKFAFDCKVRNEKREKLNIKNNMVIITIGRITKQKNPIFLIDIFYEICKLNPQCTLLYVGAGDMEQQVKEYAENKNISDKIKFLGARNDIPDLLNASDCFLFPSIYEGFGIVLLEAQLNGLRCYTSKDVVPDETNINGLVNFISLTESPQYWAKVIYNDFQIKINREDYRESFNNSGYDIKQNVEDIANSLKEQIK